VVDIRLVGDKKRAAGYVTKYAAKAIDSGVWQDPDSYTEAMAALAGRRTFATFGDWDGLDLSKPADDTTEWLPLAPLAEILSRAADGDAWAITILMRLRGEPDAEPSLFDPESPP